MLLVVFVVVLILPALKSGGFLSGTKIYDDCMDHLADAGHLRCGLDGQGILKDYDPDSCTLKCDGPRTPKLPNGVCTPGEGVICTLEARETLRNWKQELQNILNKVLQRWCKGYQKK
uniref:Putative secreted protein n=1 Tax=Ixodes ricinus TaxID=34613 RepID=V5H735_IXORI